MAGCTKEDDWKGIGLGAAFSSESDAVATKPTVSMALTKAGNPRVAFLAKNEEGKLELRLIGCDKECSADHWRGMINSRSASISR